MPSAALGHLGEVAPQVTRDTSGQEVLGDKGLPSIPDAWVGKVCKGQEAGRECGHPLPPHAPSKAARVLHSAFPPTSQVRPPGTDRRVLVGPRPSPLVKHPPSLLGNLLTLNITYVLVTCFLSYLLSSCLPPPLFFNT